MKTENYLRELFFILFRQKWLIIITTGIILILSISVAFFYPPVFTATGNILVRGKKVEKNPGGIESEYRRASDLSKEDLLSEVKIIISPNVIEKTIAELKKSGKFEFENNKKLVEEIYSVQGNLKTEIIPVSNIIKLTYYGNNPKQSVALLGELMNQYITFRLRVYNPIESESFYSKQTRRYDNLIDNESKVMLVNINKLGITEPQNEITNNLQLKLKLQGELNDLITNSIEKKSEIEFMDSVLKKKSLVLFSFIPGQFESISLLNEKLQILLVERGSILRGYNIKSDKVKLIDKHIADAYKILRMEVKDYRGHLNLEYQTILHKIESIRKRIFGIDRKNIILKKQALVHENINRRKDIYKSSFDVFSSRREEAKSIDTMGVPPGVSIIKSAFPSNGPVFPKPKFLILFGLVVGLLTGISFGFLKEYFDHTFKKPEDVTKYAELPIIFSMPMWEDKHTSETKNI